MFKGEVKDGKLYIGEDVLLPVKNVPNQKVIIGIRPEGFVLNENGAFGCKLSGVEVMGRDISVVASHEECENTAIRAIISAENKVDLASGEVRFDLKPGKVFIFNRETEERICFEVQ